MTIEINDIKKMEIKENETLLIEYDPEKVTTMDLNEMRDAMRGCAIKSYLLTPISKFGFQKVSEA